MFVGKNAHNDEFDAVDQKTGELVWKIDSLGWASVGATGYANGRIFVGTVDGKFYGINASNGHIDWKFNAGNGKGIYPHPATDDTKVYTGSHNGNHYAFDQATGKVVWEKHTANPSGKGGFPDSAATVLWKNHVYGQKRGSRIVALDRNTGEEAWEWIQPANYLQNGTITKTSPGRWNCRIGKTAPSAGGSSMTRTCAKSAILDHLVSDSWSSSITRDAGLLLWAAMRPTTTSAPASHPATTINIRERTANHEHE